MTAFLQSNNVKIVKGTNQHLLEVFRHVPLSDMPKVFKMSIAQLFCIETKQYECPDIDGVSVNLFSPHQWKFIRLALAKRYPTRSVRVTEPPSFVPTKRTVLGDLVYGSPARIARFWFRLLQCKDLANEVPQVMIKEAYTKHRKALSAVRKTPDGLLQQVRTYARQFAEKVKEAYDGRAPIAQTTAPYECTRSQGGTRKFLEPQLVYNRNQRIKTLTRIDPVVIHLVGPPGVGKSYVSEHLIRKLSDHFGIRKELARYSRSMACEHWDGYRGNLIAQIDDVFTSRDGEKDARQIIQMCSNAEWIVPMADLRDKGMKFTSEFVLLSSNHRFSRNQYINNDSAIDRRVYNPYYEFVSYNRRTHMYHIQVKTLFNDTNSLGGNSTLTDVPFVVKDHHLNLNDLVDLIFNQAMATYDERLKSVEMIDQCKYRKVFVPVIAGKDFEYRVGYQFDPCPSDLPKVKAHAIPEPLKVRMITKGEANNYILKPVQRAMHKALKSFPCFRLTSGQCILDNFKKRSRGRYQKGNHMLYVSGDYSAATDNLHMDVMQTVIDEVIKVLPPFLHEYVRRESGAHLIEYPDWTELEPILQTNGQLMGSLLSFPVLCIANAATYGAAIGCDQLVDLPALINGDDIAFRDTMKIINIWKRKARQMGLEPSVGKNFLSDSWFTVNSQFIEVDDSRVIKGKVVEEVCDEWGQVKTTKTRRFRCLDSSRITSINPSEGFNLLWSRKARNGDINTIRDALERFSKGTVVHYLKSQLKRTPRSIDISQRFGGLGRVNSRKPTKTDREINLMAYLKTRTKLVSNLDGYWKLTQLSTELARTLRSVDLIGSARSQGQYPPKRPEFEALEDEPTYRPLVEETETRLGDEWREFREFCKFYKTVPELRAWINSKNDLIPIKNGKMVTLWLTVPEYDMLPKHNLVSVESTDKKDSSPTLPD